jgi:hypothetical protein
VGAGSAMGARVVRRACGNVRLARQRMSGSGADFDASMPLASMGLLASNIGRWGTGLAGAGAATAPWPRRGGRVPVGFGVVAARPAGMGQNCKYPVVRVRGPVSTLLASMGRVASNIAGRREAPARSASALREAPKAARA